MHLSIPRPLQGAFLFAATLALVPNASAQNRLARVDGSTHAGPVLETVSAPGTTHSVGGTITITQSTSQTITALNSVSCNAGGLHTDNSYFRVFNLATHGITEAFEITSVESGVEQATGSTGASQPVEWKFYTLTNPAGAVARANFTALGTVPSTVPDAATGTVHPFPVTGITVPAGSHLVVELFTPNGQTTLNSFFIGSNPDGQSGLTYLEAVDCGVTTPTPTGAIGFPNMHWVLNVVGEVGGGGPIVNTYPSTDTPLVVPDNDPAGITSTIIVPASPNVVADVDIDLNLTHSWVGDFVITIGHDAASVVIMDRAGSATVPPGVGCSGNNVDIVADDEGTDGAIETSCVNVTPAYPVPDGHYTPNNPLSGFDGLDVEGAWTLNVSDNAGLDTGTLDSWALIITEELDTAVPQEPGAAVASLRAMPNPMSGTGTVELTVATAQQVRVAVYDMLGREMMVLLDRELSADQRAVMSIETARFEAGVYVVRATGETFETIQRVTVSR